MRSVSRNAKQAVIELSHCRQLFRNLKLRNTALFKEPKITNLCVIASWQMAGIVNTKCCGQMTEVPKTSACCFGSDGSRFGTTSEMKGVI